MIGEAIQSDTLKALVGQCAIHEAVVGRVVGDNHKWTYSMPPRAVPRLAWSRCASGVNRSHLGEPDSRGPFAEAVGITGFSVEL